jgi:hypothetical protein
MAETVEYDRERIDATAFDFLPFLLWARFKRL